jgi:hypothetical protein
MLTSVHLEILLILMQNRCTVAPNVPQALKSFWTHPMELLGDIGHVVSHFGLFEIVLVSVQDRCMVYTKRSIG